jgi:hypothetical protein
VRSSGSDLPLSPPLLPLEEARLDVAQRSDLVWALSISVGLSVRKLGLRDGGWCTDIHLGLLSLRLTPRRSIALDIDTDIDVDVDIATSAYPNRTGPSCAEVGSVGPSI